MLSAWGNFRRKGTPVKKKAMLHLTYQPPICRI